MSFAPVKRKRAHVAPGPVRITRGGGIAGIYGGRACLEGEVVLARTQELRFGKKVAHAGDQLCVAEGIGDLERGARVTGERRGCCM